MFWCYNCERVTQVNQSLECMNCQSGAIEQIQNPQTNPNQFVYRIRDQMNQGSQQSNSRPENGRNRSRQVDPMIDLLDRMMGPRIMPPRMGMF